VRNTELVRINRDKAQLQAFVHYSKQDPPACVLCGFDSRAALQFDHTNGDGAAFRRQNRHSTGKSLALFLRKRGWPKGYRVLCANCQCIERARIGVDGGRLSSRSGRTRRVKDLACKACQLEIEAGDTYPVAKRFHVCERAWPENSSVVGPRLRRGA
jgi:hypothetical protein